MLSPSSARRAEALGYTNVKVFRTGLPSWKKAGDLVLSEPGHLKFLIQEDVSHVLIDLRETDAARKGHITGAVTIPAGEIERSKELFPADKSAPVILYSEGMDVGAFKTVRGWGYKNTSVLNGGIDAWKTGGGKLATGDLATEIVYVYKPRPGEIEIDEFKAIAEERPADKLILDVRDENEAMQGMLVGAKNIPVGAVASRLAELPREKEIIVHCVTGIRAEMAYNVLKKNGYKTRFLNAVIQVDPDGKYEITKK
jgi:rhodanese-related sulfurtransferase